MNDNIFLTIGIPTFLREKSLKVLLDQISMVKPSKACEILIINNGPIFELDTHITLLMNIGYSVKLIHNKRNCGGQENVLRIYENASGEYTWLLGDDDRLYDYAIENVISCLNENCCDCLLFNANALDHPSIKLDSGYYNLDFILGGTFPLRKLMFVPLVILRTESICKALHKARLHLGCFTPQLLLIILGDVEKFYYNNIKIITCEEINIKNGLRLSLLPIFIGIGYLPSIAPNKHIKRKLFNLLISEHSHYLHPGKVINSIIAANLQGKPASVCKIARAAFRNYPLWLAALFQIFLVGYVMLPLKWCYSAASFLAIKIYKKNINLNDHYSVDRV